MCMTIYIASRSPLPLVQTPDFNVVELADYSTGVTQQFTLQHVRQAGSHTGCGCGFNSGRKYPAEDESEKEELEKSLRSSAALLSYVVEHGITEIYSCWSGDEVKPRESSRSLIAHALVTPEFYFEERQLLTLVTKS
jgi:hypothetical protein